MPMISLVSALCVTVFTRYLNTSFFPSVRAISRSIWAFKVSGTCGRVLV